MQTPQAFVKLMKHANLAVELAGLPVADLCFERHLNPPAILDAYANFTRPHPRYKVFRNKAMGIALVDIAGFGNAASYLDTVRQHGHAGPQSRKALARGYTLRRIDRNAHLDEIHAIHTSCAERQGRPLDSAYLLRRSYPAQPHCICHGVFDARGQLAAYCNVAHFGNFTATDQLMGYKNGDGAMYLLLSSIICELIEARQVAWFMYDSYLGAQPGLRDFKRRLGFHPYRARYALV